jgi:hypothetical protein
MKRKKSERCATAAAFAAANSKEKISRGIAVFRLLEMPLPKPVWLRVTTAVKFSDKEYDSE